MKRKTRLVAALLTAGILCMAQGSQMIYAAEVSESTEITEIGLTSSSVSMTYEDEHGDYVPTDNFTVTIPKTLNVNPKEDYVYDINVKGTIDADRDVWVCTDDTVTLTLTDETLASTYGISKTQTVANTIDKIQYSSEEIVDAEGYTQQGTIHKSSLNYEIEAEYTGTLNFYINVINENNIIPGTIQQNGYMTCTAEDLIAIIKDYVPENIFNHYEERITSECNSWAAGTTKNNCSLIIKKEQKTYWDSSKSENYISYYIAFYPTMNKTSSTVTRTATVTNGKYYYKYEYYVPADSTYDVSLSLRYYPSSDTYDVYRSSSSSRWGSDISFTTTETLSAELYLSPRCKLIYE